MLIEGKVGAHCHNEGLGESSDGISAKLDVMLILPTTGNDSDNIESSSAGLHEEAGKEVTKYPR